MAEIISERYGTLKQFAEDNGIGQITARRYMRDPDRMTVRFAKMLAAKTNTTVSKIIGEGEE